MKILQITLFLATTIINSLTLSCKEIPTWKGGDPEAQSIPEATILQEKESSWSLDTSSGFSVWVVLDEEVAFPQPLRTVILFLNLKDFSRENVYLLLKKQIRKYPQNSILEISVYTDRKTLSRGLRDFKAFSETVSDTLILSEKKSDQKTGKISEIADTASPFAYYHRYHNQEYIELFSDPQRKLYEVIRLDNELSSPSLLSTSRLAQAVLAGMEERLETLINQNEEVNAKDDLGWTPLLYAVKEKRIRMSSMLLSQGKADPNLPSVKGVLPVNLAAENADLNMIHLLVKYGAQINKKDGNSRVALHLAVESGNEEMVEYLLKAGADVNARDELGQTPLMCVWEEKRETTISEKLLKSGANINAVNNEGDTSLMYAIRQGNVERSRFLINQGADLSIRNVRGQNVLDYAKIGGLKEILSLFNSK
jgi:ankyrin repeat protein